MERQFIDMKATGERIKQLRIENGYSVAQLQKIFGFEYPQTIYKWEWGENLPTIDNLLFLSQIFNVEIKDVLETKK